MPDAKLWSPDDPFLYDLHVIARSGRRQDDRRGRTATSACARSSLGKDEQWRHADLCSTASRCSKFGPLDQGFWPDGLYTAPTDEALRYDIEMTKQLGFNMARKHVKVEPDRWYYWCDKLGLLVWQDMPSGDASAWRRARARSTRTPESAERSTSWN